MHSRARVNASLKTFKSSRWRVSRGGAFSAQLVPQIAALLANHQLTKADIDGFIVVSGPGSFTGLRVGLAAIKALAEILRKPIVAVSLLEVLASAGGLPGKVAVVLDAGRGDVYFGEYERTSESVQVVREKLLAKAELSSAAHELIVITPDPALAAIARGAGSFAARSRTSERGDDRSVWLEEAPSRGNRVARAVGSELHAALRCRDVCKNKLLALSF